ncbi:MAG: family 16 glycoside hydrolase [Prosthecobacter sp.]
MKTVLLSLLVLATALPAADKKPRAMRTKDIRAGETLLADNFEGEKLDPKWTFNKGGEFGAKFPIKDGALEMDQGGAQGAVIWREFPTPAQDASIQLLVRPWACKWLAFGFYAPGDRPGGERQLNIAVNNVGGVVIRDVKSQAALKAAKTNVPADEWQRVCFESKGDKITIQVNDRVVLEYKTELTRGEKAGILLNLYGGKASVDEIEVKAAAVK